MRLRWMEHLCDQHAFFKVVAYYVPYMLYMYVDNDGDDNHNDDVIYHHYHRSSQIVIYDI